MKKLVIIKYPKIKEQENTNNIDMNLKYILNIRLLLLVTVGFLVNTNIQAQQKNTNNIKGDTIIYVARSIIESAKYCTLITVDTVGEAHARMMEVFPLDDDFTIWFGTNKKSRKVTEIKNNPNITVYYADVDESGYVSVFGVAELVDNSKEVARLWKKEWENFFTDKNDFILIKLIPEKIEIISYRHGINGDVKTWRAVNYKFKNE